MQLPSLAFIDNIFHQKTMSADFFRDLLRPHFEITNFWDKTSEKGPRIDIETINQHDYVVFWQRLNPITELAKITTKIIWVPMFDSISFNYLFWKNLSLLPIKVICFSKVIHRQCEKFGIESIYVKYFIKPKFSNENLQTTRLNLFFWNRGPISFEMIKKIVDPSLLNCCIYLSRPDTNYKSENLTRENKEKFKIQIIEMNFETSKEKYINLVKKSDLFVAPRKIEGIGLSFIEAIGYGAVVLAFNNGTMNEYIEHNSNGYLFDEKTKQPIDFSNVTEVMRRSRKNAIEGYQHWLEDEKRIINFTTSNTPPKNPGKFISSLWRNLYALKLWQFKIRIKYFKI